MIYMSLSCALQHLQLPLLQHTINSGENPVQDYDLEEWKSNAFAPLLKLQDLLEQNDLTSLAKDDVARIVAIAVPMSDGYLTTESMQAVSNSKNLPQVQPYTYCLQES